VHGKNAELMYFYFEGFLHKLCGSMDT